LTIRFLNQYTARLFNPNSIRFRGIARIHWTH